MIMLNQEQTQCVKKLHEFLASPQNFICISGYAGTGKTYTIQDFIKSLDRQHWRCAASAPTNKAVSVLANFGNAAGVNVPTLTTYKLLGLVLDSGNQIRTCKVSNDGKLNLYNIIIIDECSMVSVALVDILENRIGRNQKIIFMGDPHQLNPVGEHMSPTFSMGEMLRLTQIMRQEEGSPILGLVGQLRDQCANIESRIIAESGEDENGNGLIVSNENDMIEMAVSQFDLATLEVDIQDNRYLAWRNKTVLSFNKKVRNKLYGAGADEFILGETLAILNPVFVNDEPVFFTDDEATIMKVEVATFTDINDPKGRSYQVWRLHLANHKASAVVTVLHKKSNGQYQKRLNELADAANRKQMSWQVFWGFKELFVEVRHVYGMTVHRSQGQTIKNVFLDCNDLFYNHDLVELKRLLYVGTSRASENLITNRKNLTVGNEEINHRQAVPNMFCT